MTIRDLDLGDAACRLWLAGGPSFQEYKTASLGAFRCDDVPAGERLLREAAAQLTAEGFGYLIGPMDGDTWHRYRLVTESDGSPPFFLEPSNPAFYPEVFEAAGFTVIGRYSSARSEGFRQRPLGAYTRRLQTLGLHLRPFDPQRGEEDLRAIYRLSLTAFAGNFLYTPIGEEAFLDMYRPVLGRLVPEFVWLAEDGEEQLAAFIFAIPDYLEGPSPTTLIVKTYASRVPGLGGYLYEHLQAVARAAGFTAMIHALMHEDNVSRRNSDKYARSIRRYALYGRPLAA